VRTLHAKQNKIETNNNKNNRILKKEKREKKTKKTNLKTSKQKRPSLATRVWEFQCFLIIPV